MVSDFINKRFFWFSQTTIRKQILRLKNTNLASIILNTDYDFAVDINDANGSDY